MKLALNGATTMKSDLETDIRAAAFAGFDCLEIWLEKLRTYLRSNRPDVLKALFESAGVRPHGINSIENASFRDAPGRRRLMEEADELCAIASAIDCPCIVVVPGRLPAGGDRDRVIEESVSVLGELSVIAEPHGVSMAFEFLGQRDCSVQTLELASEIVELVARPNIGLVVDSFHFHAGGSSFSALESLDPTRILVFHINDAEPLPRETLEDRHRLLPGQGILPLGRMVSTLKEIGFDGVVSVEIFRPEYWDRDPFQLALEARAAVMEVTGSL